MTEHDTRLSRRSVLEATATGTAALAGLGAVGTASAGHLLPGQCARLTIDVQPFTEACPNAGFGPVIEAGTEGTVWATCTTDDGTTMILFRHSQSRTDRHWVSDQYFEPC